MEQKAFELGITADKIEEFPNSGDRVQIHGQLVEKAKRDQLIHSVKTKGFDQVMEEMAYTWFNRFIALRFMEVNGYLPSGVRILSSKESKSVEPDIFREITNVHEALNLDLDKVFELQDAGDSEELFKHLIIAQCNALHKILPFMFEPLDDYSELLFPDNLLVEDSVIRRMVTTIDESQWREVEIIGWLYQFYVAEKKRRSFRGFDGEKQDQQRGYSRRYPAVYSQMDCAVHGGKFFRAPLAGISSRIGDFISTSLLPGTCGART